MLVEDFSVQGEKNFGTPAPPLVPKRKFRPRSKKKLKRNESSEE